MVQDLSHSATPMVGGPPGAPPPARLGRYRVLDEVAVGGMATLFLGTAEGIGGFEKLVALKRIHPHLAKEQRYLDMFLDEARLAARIVHPNVCGVIDFGETGGEHFLAMEFIAGVSLAELVRATARNPTLRSDPRWQSVVARVLIDAAEGLHAAHELRDANGADLRVVHRDVSPQNIHIGFDGVTRVLDFGVAAAADRIHHTQTGEVKGKFAYMAPEQVRQSTPDRRIDVWALGVVAWEAFAMKRLFKREGTASTLYAVLEEPIQPLSVVAPSLPRALDVPILEALRRERDRRTPTTRAFGQALREACEKLGRPVADAALVASYIAEAMPGKEAELRQRIAIARDRAEALDLSDLESLAPPANEMPSRWRWPAAFVAIAVVGLGLAAVALWLRPSDGDELSRVPPLAPTTVGALPSSVPVPTPTPAEAVGPIPTTPAEVRPRPVRREEPRTEPRPETRPPAAREPRVDERPRPRPRHDDLNREW